MVGDARHGGLGAASPGTDEGLICDHLWIVNAKLGFYSTYVSSSITSSVTD